MMVVYGILAVKTLDRGDIGYILIFILSRTPTTKETVEGDGSLLEVLL